MWSQRHAWTRSRPRCPSRRTSARGPARRTPASARAPTMIAASEPPSSPASPAKARRSPRPRRGAGKASWPRGPRTSGASARAALSAAPAPSSLLASRLRGSWSPRRFALARLRRHESARVPRAIPAGLEPGAFSSARTSATPARVSAGTRLASAEDVSDARRPIPSPAIPALKHFPAEGGRRVLVARLRKHRPRGPLVAGP